MVDQVHQIRRYLANVWQVVERRLGSQHVLLDRRADIIPGLAVGAQKSGRPGVQIPPELRPVLHKEIKAGLNWHLAVPGKQGFDILRVSDENMMPFDARNAKAKDIAVSGEEAVEEVMVLLQLGIAPLIVQDLQERLGRNFGKGPRSFVGDSRL
jgi:hypothetical protein